MQAFHSTYQKHSHNLMVQTLQLVSPSVQFVTIICDHFVEDSSDRRY